MAATFSYRFYRDQWIDKMAGLLQGYEACEKYGRDGKAAERMLMIPFFVDETTDKAIKPHGHVRPMVSRKAETGQRQCRRPFQDRQGL